MQDRSAFKYNNNASFKVHRKLTPDVNLFVMPEVFNRASSAFVSGFPLKDCGNDRLELGMFMQRLGLSYKIKQVMV